MAQFIVSKLSADPTNAFTFSKSSILSLLKRKVALFCYFTKWPWVSFHCSLYGQSEPGSNNTQRIFQSSTFEGRFGLIKPFKVKGKATL